MNGIGLTLDELGRRLERLLYFGALLLLACFLQLYFVSATIYARLELPDDISEMIAKVEENFDHLQSLYKESTSSSRKKLDADERKDILETRRLLGLPEPRAKSPPKETYGEALEGMFGSIAKQSSRKWAKTVVDSLKSPEVLLADLRQRRQELKQKSISVWGIETPFVVPVQYGTASYQIPTSFIANALVVALAPLLIAWFGSVYVTRQRELLILRQLRDYKLAFPHVLNVLPVMFMSLSTVSSRRYRSARELNFNQIFNRLMSSFVRSFIHLLFVVPMLLIFGYSIVNLTFLRADVNLIELGVAGSVFVCLIVQAILLVSQEWLLLWGKDYYA